jgi:pimeloyl-ACP methyl ester carboxylesterase
VKRSVWQGFDRIDFVVDGRKCLLVQPRTAAAGKPWIWRTEFFGHEPQADVALLGRGFHVAYMDVQNMYGAPVAIAHMEKFHAFLTSEFGLSSKPVLEGFSRGGLFAFNFAAKYPDQVSAIYADAPVCDFKSWPGGKGNGKGSPADWERLKAVYGFAADDEAFAFKGNPVDVLAPLAKAGIPLLHVCGDADDVVPLEENTRLIEQRYKAIGGPIELIIKPGVGHHPHNLKDPAPIVEFVVKHAK